MMNIIFHKASLQFHIYNDFISYIIGVSPAGEMENLYFGARIHDREDLSYTSVRTEYPNMCVESGTSAYSLEVNRREYPSFGTTDFGASAFEIETPDGSCVSSFIYKGHKIFAGKNRTGQLPGTYAGETEAMTLEVYLEDACAGMMLTLSYTIFEKYAAIARHAVFANTGNDTVKLNRALSLCIDLPDQDYEWVQFSGAWARERIPEVKKLSTGTVMIESRKGVSSSNQNPFIIIKRPNTDESCGEAIGISLVYSGNFIALAEGNSHDRLRIMAGINPYRFTWILNGGESFETPEAVIAYTKRGLNSLSRTYHKLYNNNLVRGRWKNHARPILINNWEATYMDFDEERILKIAKKAKEAGVELFVLDDGWFGHRDDDTSSLGDWTEDRRKLPNGIKGLAEKITAMGLKFGFWIEPEMVSPDSRLFEEHPDWALSAPGRKSSLGRHQLVLDFSRKEIVDAIYDMLFKIIKDAPVSYIKWDMNRTLTEVYSTALAPHEQGMVYHKYVLGVYSLYERLTETFPDILFESCSAGGNRFDAGMLYYAPQAWCSDNTDALDRIRIQYGTSYGYPIVSMGSHVSAVPNQQTGRSVSLKTRADVAYFGTFGYELDLNELSDEEFEEVKEQIAFMKKYRELIQFGDFYRLISPFENDRAAWMVVSEDKRKALVGFYILRGKVNSLPGFLKLEGLNENLQYDINGRKYFGDELMNLGLALSEMYGEGFTVEQDGRSFVAVLSAKE